MSSEERNINLNLLESILVEFLGSDAFFQCFEDYFTNLQENIRTGEVVLCFWKGNAEGCKSLVKDFHNITFKNIHKIIDR